MDDVFIILLACLGMTWVIKYGTILEPIRKILFKYEFFQKLMTCCMCAGWWVGLFWQFFITGKPPWYHFMLPFVSSAFCYACDTVLNMAFDLPKILAGNKTHKCFHGNENDED